jgi:PAS domain S-box-containing protein/putative nucleotidyltransferase with HDIG domain
MKYDGQEHLCAIVRDTTERQRIEGTLRRAEEEKAGILDSLSEMVTYCSQDLRILWANKSAGTSAGLNPAELVGSRCYEVWHNFKRPCSDCPVLNAFKTGDYMEKEVAVSGDKIWLVKAHPVKDSEGSVSGVVEVVSDITGRKKIEQERRQNYDKSRRILEETVIALAATAERRDPYTAGHQRRVAQLACAIAREMGLGEELIEGVRMASIIHDVGKIYVPAEMLSKPSGLSDLEFSIIKTHPQIGYEILKPVEFPWPVARIVLQHHEKINGSGYPEGISGEDILIESRILTVADVVEAMASYRPYRAALGIEEALTEITKNKGSLYDCRVVDTCLKLFRKKLFKFEQKSTLP